MKAGAGRSLCREHQDLATSKSEGSVISGWGAKDRGFYLRAGFTRVVSGEGVSKQ